MAGYADEERALTHDTDLSPARYDLDLYTHIEGLVGEETELQKQADESHKQEHHARLRAIGEELDRAWEMLRRRAERRSKPDD
jgi:hypothetical protein